jgi:hypothetical protein
MERLLWRQNLSHALQPSFDHLVGGGELRRRHQETERPGGMVVETSSNFDAPAPSGLVVCDAVEANFHADGIALSISRIHPRD